ncbi:MAG: site-specific DNA-methyltransferase [Armatimonadetes bacterium]|nr:site-specific DNA-methyltransferase [Armatimonadota bacterium]
MAYHGDALEVLRGLPDASVNLVVTSPPFALRRKKAYGNVSPDQYKGWFIDFAREFWRLLAPDGSLVIDIGGAWTRGLPTRSLYHFKLLIALCEELGEQSFHLAQEFYWYNPAKLPTPAEWVTVRRIRVKDSVNTIWWLSKSPQPDADNRRVLRPYTKSMRKLLKGGYNAGPRPSEHVISTKWAVDRGGAIPSNLITVANTRSGGSYLTGCRAADLRPHPARFPDELPRFFIQFLTRPGAVVLDPFAGSNVTGQEAERLGRYWIAVEREQEYLLGSRFRFLAVPGPPA